MSVKLGLLNFGGPYIVGVCEHDFEENIESNRRLEKIA
jgi:hypothetical protein